MDRRTNETMNLVLAARELNPSAPALAIAKEIGISRERVRQILVKLNLPTKVRLPPRFRSGGLARIRNPYRYSVRLPPHTVGAVCELQVCVDLLQLGYHVFRSVSPHGRCDLIAILDDAIIQIEVRAAKKGNCARTGTYDCLAAVEPDGTIKYMPELVTFNRTTP